MALAPDTVVRLPTTEPWAFSLSIPAGAPDDRTLVGRGAWLEDRGGS